MLPTSSATASAAPIARGTWWRASEATMGLKRIAQKHAEDDGMSTDCAYCSTRMAASTR